VRLGIWPNPWSSSLKTLFKKEGREYVVWNSSYVGFGGGYRLVDGVGNEERQREKLIEKNFPH
jgi:hypothetical protein